MRRLSVIFFALSAAACGSSSAGTSTGTGSGASSGATTGSSGSSSGTAATSSGAGTSTSSSSSGSGSSTGGSNASASNGGSATATTGAPTTWAKTVLLDNDGNDGYANNPPTDDFSLGFYETWLAGKDTGEPALLPAVNAYLYAEPSDGSDTNTPTYKDLTSAPTTQLIWFTSAFYGSYETISNAQDASLVAWLQTGGKTLVLFAPTLFYDRGVQMWAGPETDPLLASFAIGDSNNPPIAAGGSDTNPQDLTSPIILTGSSNSYFTGKSWTLAAGEAASQYAGTTNYSVKDYFGGVNPVTGADVLATIQADPTKTGTTNMSVPIIVGVKNATVGGMATTSTIVYVGLTPENINNGLATNTMQDLFAAVQQYAGL